MPELPEVETIKKGLEKTILGKKITEVVVNKKNVIKEPALEVFKQKVCGRKIAEIIRRGKLLIIKLEGAGFLIIHLRIAGWLVYGKLEEKARLAFKVSGGKYLNYMDQRLLGEVRLVKDYRELNFVKTLGPEPFGLSLRDFEKIIKSRKTKIKNLLLDQKIIAGIGNIYAQEALFLSGIDPRKPAGSLTSGQAKTLLAKIVLILKKGIKHGGSSVDNYRNVQGEKGGMEKMLKVYGRGKDLCFVCKKPLLKISLAGRGTCFCPRCQK